MKLLNVNLHFKFEFLAMEASKADVDEAQEDGEKKHENEQHKVSTTFDLIAVCSNPTWLGSEKTRKSRRRKSYFPVRSPLAMVSCSVLCSTGQLMVHSNH